MADTDLFDFFAGCASPEAEEVVRDVLSRAAGRWSTLILHLLAAAPAPMRFSRLRDGASGITQRVLTHTLRQMERDGLVTRRVYAEVPPRVEYAITPLGRGLVARIGPLIAWAREEAETFAAAQARFDGEATGGSATLHHSC